MARMIGPTIAFATSQDFSVVSDQVLTLPDGVDQIRVTVAGGIIPAIIGIIGGEDLQAVVLYNVSGIQIAIYKEHPSAPSASRFVNAATIDAHNGALLWRDPYVQAWRVLSCGGTV